MSEMGDGAAVESGDSGGGSAESGTEAGEQEPAGEGDGTELAEVSDGGSTDDGQFVEGGDDGPAEGGREAVADVGESGEGEPAEEGDGDAPTADAVDTGEVDEGAAERSLMGESAPAEAGEGEPATEEIEPEVEAEPLAEGDTAGFTDPTRSDAGEGERETAETTDDVDDSTEDNSESEESADDQDANDSQGGEDSAETPPRPAGLPSDVQMPDLPPGLGQKGVEHSPGDATPSPNTPNVLPKPESSPSKEIAPGR
jgi:hypothetical protein